MNDEVIAPAMNEAVGGGAGARQTEPDTVRRLSRKARVRASAWNGRRDGLGADRAHH